MSTVNHQFRLGVPSRRRAGSQRLELYRGADGEPKDGEVLVKVLYISLDPAMRGWMNEGKSYVPPVAIGDVMRALGAGKVIASKFPGLAVGDYVSGIFGVQEYAVAPGKAVNKIDAPADKLPVYIGGLGMPGMTAYFGLLDVGRPEAGNTVVVSGAAGAVGSIVGQIAKIKGCTVIGIAGGAEKCAYLKEIGFDAAIDYKAENVLAALCAGIVRKELMFISITSAARFLTLPWRIWHLTCARRDLRRDFPIQQHDSVLKAQSNYLSLLVNRASMTGMVVVDYLARAGEASNRDVANG